MRRFPRDVRDFHNVPISENELRFQDFASSGGGGSFVLSPGYQAIEGGNVPQVFPGQQHDASPPPALSNPPLPVSAAPQNVGVVSSPLPPAAPSSSPPVNPSIEPAPPVSTLPSGSPSAQISAAIPTSSPSEVTPYLSSPLSSIPPTSPGTVATSTDTTSPSLTSISPTLSPITTPAAAITSSMNPHGASFWAGIALLSIAGVATLVTLFLWWLRIRERTHRRPWERPRWLWGRTESYKFPEDAISSSGTSGSLWQPQGDREVGEPQRSTSTLLSPSLLSRRTSGREPQPHLPTISAMSPFTHGLYPTVRPLPLELRLSDTSVPGLMQDVGSLHVANLVAGDILTSGDESSRPPTALDDVGTPRESSLMLKPRYLSLNGSGLDVPWIQTPLAERKPKPTPGPVTRPGPGTQHPSTDATTPLNYNRWKERLERSYAKPGESHTDSQPVTIETWRDSLRNNIASAFGAFTSAHPPAPVRPSVTAYNWQDAATAVARAPSTVSTASKSWTLEETREGAGIVHIRGVQNPFASSSSLLSSGSRPLPTPPPLPPHASLIPPCLPHLPPMPHVPRSSASAARSTSMRRQHGSRRWRGMMRRASSLSSASSVTASEATSVGSDMSRASGATAVARWARLSEKEEAARRALRQRRLQSVSSSSTRKRTRGRDGGG